LAILVFIVGGVLIYWFCLFTAQVVAIERKYWFSALRRSAYIVSKSKRRSLVILLITALLYVLSFIFALIPVLGVRWLVLGPEFIEGNSLLGDFAATFVYVAYVPIPNIFLTLAYYHLRLISKDLSSAELADIKAYEMT
jgi:hypothetical protein